MFLPKRKSRFNGKPWRSGNRKGSRDTRLFVLAAVFAVLFCLLLHRLWDLQIINGQKYAQDYELKITRTIREHNTRGLIYDCNGEILAYNELVYAVTMTDDGTYGSERERQLALNGIIYHMIKKLEENHEQVYHELKIAAGSDGNFTYTVSGYELDRFKADVFGKAAVDELTPEQKAVGADEMIQFLTGNHKFALYGEGKSRYTKEELKKYRLPEQYTKEELLAITGIRYMLSLNSYKKYVPVVLARDVSEQTIAYVIENQLSLPGIAVSREWNRVYPAGEAFSHILGYTGKISPEEMEKYADSDRDYRSDAVVGKAGLEQYFEEHLQGIDGERQIMVNNVGKITGEQEVVKEAVSGGDVYLSIDKNLQNAVYKMLEQSLAGILSENLIPAKTFDKSGVLDASDIRIPIYDVYLALINNNVLSIEEMYQTDAAELERNAAERLEAKKKEVRGELKAELLERNEDISLLSEEMQEYIFYMVNHTGILDEAAIDLAIENEDDIYKSWQNKKGVSVKTFLFHGMEQGWITSGFMDERQHSDMQGLDTYITIKEMYRILVETIGKKLEKDSGFEKLLFKWLVLDEKITGRDICRLLYDQQVLQDTDGDYDKLMAGGIDPYTLLKKKIERLEITPAQLALDPCSASAVVVQPETGKVLALVSYPGYDNNRLANQMDAAYYNQLLNDRSLPLYNRASQQLTAPGSTFKPVTIVAGLQEGIIRPNTSIFCDGIFDKVEPGLKCWNHSGHGNVSGAAESLQFSCNDYMCEIAYQLGTENGRGYTDSLSLKRLQKYANLFSFNKKSGIEIPESEPHVTDAYGIPSAIGQGTHNYAVVQLARYTSAIAVKGDVFSLSLVKGTADADGKFTERKAELLDRIELPDSVWNVVHSGMERFAENNGVLKDMKITAAGKTGTAQEAKNRPDHALFVGYAPVKQPQIAVAVRIVNGYGSSYATAVGKDIFEYYFGLEKQE